MEKRRLTVESVIEELDENGIADSCERSQNTYIADLIIKDGAVLLLYSEEQNGAKINVAITAEEARLSVRRTGAIESDFVFIENERTFSLYKIPPYSFDAQIFTRKIRGSITSEGGTLSVLYNMTVGGAEKSVRMKLSLSEVAL